MIWIYDTFIVSETCYGEWRQEFLYAYTKKLINHSDFSNNTSK